MQQLVLKDPTSGSSARIAAHLGFNCIEFRAVVAGQVIDVIDAAEDLATIEQRPSGHGIPVLFPFPNRIREGKYRWNDREYHITNEKIGYDGIGNAIHGFAIDRPWRVVEQAESYAVGQFQLSVDAPERLECWPTDCAIGIRYEVRGACLRADVRISNPSDVPLPWGFGTHPYFRLPLGNGSNAGQCLIEAPAAEQWELVDYLPTGTRSTPSSEKDLREGAYFRDVRLDDVYTGVTPVDGRIESTLLDGEAGLQITQRHDPSFRELVVFSPPNRNAICIEPYTCVTDAINLESRGIDTGLQILLPGAETRCWIEIEAGQIVA